MRGGVLFRCDWEYAESDRAGAHLGSVSHKHGPGPLHASSRSATLSPYLSGRQPVEIRQPPSQSKIRSDRTRRGRIVDSGSRSSLFGSLVYDRGADLGLHKRTHAQQALSRGPGSGPIQECGRSSPSARDRDDKKPAPRTTGSPFASCCPDGATMPCTSDHSIPRRGQVLCDDGQPVKRSAQTCLRTAWMRLDVKVRAPTGSKDRRLTGVQSRTNVHRPIAWQASGPAYPAYRSSARAGPLLLLPPPPPPAAVRGGIRLRPRPAYCTRLTILRIPDNASPHPTPKLDLQRRLMTVSCGRPFQRSYSETALPAPASTSHHREDAADARPLGPEVGRPPTGAE